MNIHELPTPSFLVDLDVLEANIKDMADLCRKNNKELWPMVKTHKSSAIARMQYNAGAAGFLVGTIDEAEKLVSEGFKNIMLAYPVAALENLKRVIELGKKAHIIMSIDGTEAALQANELLEKNNMDMEYLIIVDCGLHRFGVKPEKADELADELQKFSRLKLKGIGTHPGHVYASSNIQEVELHSVEEIKALETAKGLLQKKGYRVDIVATGSTPTAKFAAKSNAITVLRPGNYVFYDNIQLAMGVTSEEHCALTVLATVISHPAPDKLIVDAGSKCLGLDKGAHGISIIKGFGIVKDHPELVIIDLSEEVGKIKIEGKTNLKVGDKIQIIPNHACSSVNMTNYLIGHRKNVIEDTIYIDVRGGSYRKPPIK